MRYSVIYDYNYLMNKIENYYKGTFNQKMMQFCRDVKITFYRMKKILENKAYFLTPEQDKIIEILNIPENEVVICFHTRIEA